jgi:hypothetical protein
MLLGTVLLFDPKLEEVSYLNKNGYNDYNR